MVDATFGLIEVGVGTVDADTIADGSHEDTADVVALRIDDLQPMEEQRMMTHHHLTVALMCFLDHLFSDVETGKDATDLHAGITALEASVVIRFLQFTRRKGR